MMTVDELFDEMEAHPELYADAAAGPVNDIITINAEERKIIIPDSEKLFGVEHDENAERKYFTCPRVVGDNIDLSDLKLFVNYKNAGGDTDIYPIDDVKADGDNITFSWLLWKSVTRYKTDPGTKKFLSFLICAKKDANQKKNDWNTTLCSDGVVLVGLEPGQQIAEDNPDIIQYILERLDSAGTITPEQIQEAVDGYMAENPLTAEDVGALPADTKIPAKTSDLQNDSGFQTGTQVQNTVNAAISNITHFHFAKITELPASGEDNIIYLLPAAESENDKYEEYLFVDGAWELIGNTDIDLSGYALKTEIPTELKNPNALTINVGSTVLTYDGSGAATVTIPDAGVTERIEKSSTDTAVELQPNKLYIFPEMPTLTYTLGAEDAGVTNEYHFIFQSGATPTEVVHPSGVNVGSLTVEANKIYEISVMENMLAYQSWAVN